MKFLFSSTDEYSNVRFSCGYISHGHPGHYVSMEFSIYSELNEAKSINRKRNSCYFINYDNGCIFPPSS